MNKTKIDFYLKKKQNKKVHDTGNKLYIGDYPLEIPI